MSKIEQKTLSFSIDGPGMTKLAREFCYHEKNIPKAFKLLWEITQSDQLSEGDHIKLVLDILNGNAKIVGTYPNDDYGIEKTNDNVKGLETLLQDMVTEQKQATDRIQELLLQRNWLLSCVSEDFPNSLEDYLHRYEDEFETKMLSQSEAQELGISVNRFFDNDSPLSNMLMEVLERQHSKHDTDQDYGWLEPNGVFHAVPWGEHYDWAADYLESHLTEDQLEEQNVLMDPGDFLRQKGWVLLHSPHQGIARTSIHPTKQCTKAQKDFLYGYYIDRNHTDLANQIMQDDN